MAFCVIVAPPPLFDANPHFLSWNPGSDKPAIDVVIYVMSFNDTLLICGRRDGRRFLHDNRLRIVTAAALAEDGAENRPHYSAVMPMAMTALDSWSTDLHCRPAVHYMHIGRLSRMA